MKRRDFLGISIGGLAGVKGIFPLSRFPIRTKNSKVLQEPYSDVIVKVLGTAQDGGFPQIGCYCTNCLSARANPQLSRLIASLAVIDLHENQSFLVDATPDIRAQTNMIHERRNLNKSGNKNAPSGVFLSHAHIGHYTGLMFYGYESQSTHKLPVYCSKRMGHFLATNGPWSQLVNFENISLQILSLDIETSLNKRISVMAFQVPHRNEYSDTIGFVISGEKKKLLYIPDIQSWQTWNRSVIDEVAKVDIAILDGTFFSPTELPGRDISQIGHPLITTSMRILQNAVKKEDKDIYFSHMNHSNLALNPEGTAKKEVEEKGFKLASDGMEFFL